MNERGPKPSGAEWFPVVVWIEDRETGGMRSYSTWEREDEDGWSDYIWSDGNYGCDCNRALFFSRANGLECDGRTHTCGDERYRVVALIDVRDEKILYSEPA